MSKTSQREATAYAQGVKDRKNALVVTSWYVPHTQYSRYYRKNTCSRFYNRVAPYGYASGWSR